MADSATSVSNDFVFLISGLLKVLIYIYKSNMNNIAVLQACYVYFVSAVWANSLKCFIYA